MSKRVFQHPTEPAGGRKYWRSLGQLSDTPEFRQWLEREFPQGAAEFQGGEVSRRSFLQLMGASMALAGLGFAGCRRPEKHLVPFTRGVEWSIPGKALFYATSMPHRRGYQPLVATTHDGRPTKIEGNPLHPASKGASDHFAQASLLDLYDPERLRGFAQRTGKEEFERREEGQFVSWLDARLQAAGNGESVAFLVGRDNSPTRERLRGEIERKLPGVFWAEYEPLGDDVAASVDRAIYGEGVRPVAALDKADVILALDSDFLGIDSTLPGQRAWARRRKPEGGNKMNRLYVVENRFTLTGGMSDHRFRLPASQIGAFAAALAAQVAAQAQNADLDALAKSLPQSSLQVDPKWIQECAADLIANRGRSLVLVGDRQPAAVQALVAAINAALGAIGETLVATPVYTRAARSIVELAEAIKAGTIKTLFILNGNPVFNAPADLNFAGLLETVEAVVRLGSHADETALHALWQVPAAHYLESWGDGRAVDGSYVSVQPMILPLFGGWSEIDLLSQIARGKRVDGPELIQETFREIAKPQDFLAAWTKFLHDGFVAAEVPNAALNFNAGAVRELGAKEFPAQPVNDQALEVVLTADSTIDDGRYANNGWLQELPDPVTKLTWDNAAWVSPATAKRLGLEDTQLVEITAGDRKLTIPVLVVPGHADNSLTIPLGYGRTAGGKVCTVQQTPEGFSSFNVDETGVGFDSYVLRTTQSPYFVTGATLRKTGKKYNLAITQEHGTLEGRGPDLVRETTRQDLEAHKGTGFIQKMGMDSHIPPDASLYSHPKLDDVHQWGMSIDMNACIGCGGCMVACQAENNIPVVGKRQVIDGREMHWIRCDRYFASEDDSVDDPEMVSQPMTCQHCENAPCETVCPVNATVHSEDGLNVMAYNRCIGTRYCANNCPFKVRRFNFFDYNQRKIDELRKWNLISEKGMAETLKLSKNPNVTVRMRGVMEKCSFCVQRIQEAKIAAKVAHRDAEGAPMIKPDSFTVACAQACPTEAIVFGDIKTTDRAPETHWSITKVWEHERSYEMLKYLHLHTRVRYLARVRNPNMKMPGAEKVAAYSRSHHHGSGDGAHKSNGTHH